VPAPARFLVVTINASPIFTFTNPVSVPRSFGVAIPSSPRTFDMMPTAVSSGLRPRASWDPARPRFASCWIEELKRLVPTK
jgi:hypothetical protein